MQSNLIAQRMVQWAQLWPSVYQNKECLHSKKNQFDKREQDWLVYWVCAVAASKAWRDSGRACFSLHRSRRQKETLLVGCARLSVQDYWICFFFLLYFQQVFTKNQGNKEEEKRKDNNRIQDVYNIRVYRLVCCIRNGVSYHSICQPSYNHCLYEEQKPSQKKHVLGYKLDRSRHVGWCNFRGSYIPFFTL